MAGGTKIRGTKGAKELTLLPKHAIPLASDHPVNESSQSRSHLFFWITLKNVNSDNDEPVYKLRSTD